MRKKIGKLNNDIFDTRPSLISFSNTHIFFRVNVNEVYTGGFQIDSKDYKMVRGMIYTSTFRMQTRVNGFESESAYINYTFNAYGLRPGEKIKGKFIILTEAGEFEIYFCASVNVTTIESKYGSFSNLEEFRELAYTDYESAFKCFISNKFRETLPSEQEGIINLYDGLNRFEIDKHAMEEFLIGVNLKNSISIVLSDDNKEYSDLEFSISDGINIIKDDWGYLPIEVKTDCDFIETEINRFSSLDFKENEFRFEYTIVKEKLHEGNNFATIQFVTPYETKKLSIIVRKKIQEDDGTKKEENRRIRKLKSELIKNYVLFRSQSIDGTMWKNLAIPALDELFELSGELPVYKMIKSHVYKDADMDEEGRVLLEQFDREFWSSGKNEILWSYYLYIVSMYKSDISYTMKASDEVRKIYNRNSTSWELLWILTRMDLMISSDIEKKLSDLEIQWTEGHFSSILYLEAYNMLKDMPSLLEYINPFMLQVLIFAKRKNILTEDIARYIAIISGRIREYNPRLFELLTGCYKVLPSKDILSAICRFLIVGRKSDHEYFSWYEKGVNEGLHIANLYEYYMYAFDESKEYALPHNIYLYFARPNNIDYRKKAYIYADIVKNKDRYPEIFSRVENEIMSFTREQLRYRHINDNLKYLYDRYLETFNLNREENKALADLYYTYEISVDAPNLSQAIILHKGLISPSVVSIIDGKCLVELYTNDDQILLQDKSGRVFIKTIPFRVQKCIGDEHFREYIRENCPMHIGVLISTCYSRIITPGNLSFYRDIIDVDAVQDSAKIEIKKMLLWYFYETDNHVGVGQYISHIQINQLSQEERSMYFGILLGEKRIKNAYGMISEYGYEGIDSELLLEFCDEYIPLVNYEEDVILSELAMYLFKVEITSENILKYLEEVYCGTTDSMIEIWHAVHDNNKPSNHIEERILIQMMFCDEVTDDSDIFDSYYHNSPNVTVKNAYLSYKAFSFFAFNNELEPRFFGYILDEFTKGNKISTSWALAALKYYEGVQLEDERLKTMLDSFIEQCTNKNLVFGFFRSYSDEILNRLSLTNRYIVSYQGTTRSKITIHYCITREGEEIREFKEEIMPQLYHTYYLKEFILFKGEVLHYYLVEEISDRSRIVEVQKVSQEEFASSGTGRFFAINHILSEEHPEVKLEEYEKKSYLVNQLFQIR